MTIAAIENLIVAAIENQGCVSAKHAFRVARTAAREMAAFCNDEKQMAALRNIEAVTTMGLAITSGEK